MVTAAVRIQALPGQREALLEALGPAIELTRANPKCTRFEVYLCEEDPDQILLVEDWPSAEDHFAHFEDLDRSGAVSACEALWAAPPDSFHYTRAG